jgi:PPOX class probable F420-dependent enzyme
MSPQECRYRFGGVERAVLGTAGEDGVPHLVPVTFALVSDADGVDVVVVAVDHKPKRTTRLRRLRNVLEQPRVSFRADEYSPDWANLWWVRADGAAQVVESGERHDAAREALMARYPQYRAQPPSGDVIWARIDRWVGWAPTLP